MALRKSRFLLALLIAAAAISPAHAEDYLYNYMNHSDSITIGLGDAPTSNIVIQHPTPWPSYVNNTRIRTSAAQCVSALENMMLQYMPGGSRTQYSDGGTASSSGGSMSGPASPPPGPAGGN